MDLSKLVPQHRIEIRRAGSAKREPWIVAELAHTAEHLAVKLGFWKGQPDIEFRTVNNFLTAAEPVVAAVAAIVQPAEPMTKKTAAPVVATTPAVATAPAVIVTPVAGSPEAVTGATPLPFNVGDFVRDVHTGVKVRVTGINPDGRAGFSWEKTAERVEGDADHTGFCPLASVGAFAPAKESEPAEKKPTGVEAPPPEVKAPAAGKPAHAPKTPRASKKKTAVSKPPAAPKSEKKGAKKHK